MCQNELHCMNEWVCEKKVGSAKIQKMISQKNHKTLAKIRLHRNKTFSQQKMQKTMRGVISEAYSKWTIKKAIKALKIVWKNGAKVFRKKWLLISVQFQQIT